VRCRKNYRDLNAVERDRFVQALYHVKSTGIVDQFANDHDTFFHAAHHSSHFLPWHREFLRRFENALRTYHPDVTIPYWNSTVDTSPSDPLWNNDFIGQFDAAWGLGRTLGAATLPTPQRVQDTLALSTYDAFWPDLEIIIHNPPHNWVGGAMATGASPRDPVFYLHHCWIDLLWAQWQLQNPGASFVSSGTGRGLNDAMQPWTTTPADVLDHRTINLYHYPSGFQQDPPVVMLETPTITFNDVPEGVTAPRAASFSVSSCTPTHFEIDVPIVTSRPPGTIFGRPFGSTAALQSDEDLKSGKAYIWITYTGTSDGDSATGEVTVRNVETNQQWTIPITANTVRRPTVAVALVLDRSGSMNESSGLGEPLSHRIDVLRFAATHFVDVIRENNAIGIVSFNQDAYEEMPVTPINTIDPIDAARITAKGTITTNITPGGYTSIGDGIEKAHNMLNPVTGYDTKATIVFTDGHENRPKYISDIADIINEKVFAIGLGTAQQLNPGALEAITNGTGGYLLLTGKLNPDYYFLLSKYYLQILAGVTNEDIVLDPEGWIKPGQEHRIPFRLNEADISTDIILIQQSGITRVSGPPNDVSVFHFNVFKFLIESPNGDIIDPTVASTTPGVSYVDGTNLSFYRVALPLPIGKSPVSTGIWHAILTIDKEGYKKYLSSLDNYPKLKETIKTHGIRYRLNVHAYSNVRMRSTLSQNSYEPGATMNLRTNLTQYGIPLKSSATVRAELRRPDNTSSTLNLLEVEDGVFEASKLALMPGIYHFRVYCNGVTLRGRPFTREQMLTGAVWQYGDQPPPTSKDDPLERDERLCKLLECILSKEVISQELERRLSTFGINIDILRKCLKAYYCTDISSSTESPVVPKNELSSLLQNPMILSFLKGVVEEMQRNKI
jgi:hypothetical protein